ncbi:hypothetical protein [Micromonospora aurantiaca (nom. illeg.)]|uniref:hypothetical protein n=1 Tax=Micromonospora aurantiaca (nom. illeg.) TaxID=47850 RepID=UPI0011A971B0|nr:hypothetical protein [Micromonospora aurantiaca]MBC9000450.1 hypothetical protein [Micromonospora aurantiaca]
MSEWVRRWEIEVRWRPGLPGDRLSARRVDTVAELRQLVAWARANPDITRHQHRTVRELAGDPPAACPNGHPYDGGSATRAARGWTTCPCGGHLILACRWPGCGDVSHDPPKCAELH